jgi:PIN domain nuclease of toxin-antitoxin system
LIAYLNGEPGTDIVEELLEQTTTPQYIHAINLLEIFYYIAKRTDVLNARKHIALLLQLGIQERADLDAAFWEDAATLKADHVVALGDCCGLALARRLGAEFITADRGDMKTATAANVCKITLIR